MRLFIALEIPLELRQALADRARAGRRRWPAARWVRPEAMHLTLTFLGETDPDRLPALNDAFTTACAGTGALDLRLTEAGAFPPRGKARVLWTGLTAVDSDEPPRALLELQRRVAQAAHEAAGVEPERRPFHPHVTLARLKTPWACGQVERFRQDFGAPPGESFQVAAATLFESELHPSGARYRVVQQYGFEPA